MNNINNIWNYDFIKQQAQQNYHQSQIRQVIETVHKLKDFLDSSEKVDAPYQDVLVAECCAVLFNYAQKHNMF